MKAIVVRNLSTGKIVCMGPDNGMYDPGVPAGCTKAVEDNYEGLLAEHAADLAAQPKLPTLDEELATLKSRLAALETKG